ncbi:DUF6318 family protein [Kocuria sp.]|uniref:DUF6318 family protein n=1 Tax=Kocuria sp. TaxID=1871328 RepID=UPI0026E00D3D|nr:DUF6318 family protein [Kocuria sp.]MDO5619757.1 DUF6318 family protein [Kocuria sp.]
MTVHLAVSRFGSLFGGRLPVSARSAVFTASAVLLLAGVLTGCGDTNDAAGGGGDPSTTSASASGSAGGSASATGGEYVEASAEGPAQNVPEPTKPALADEESVEGAQAFLDYLSDARAYAMQTGDTSFAREITAEQCESCINDFDTIDSHYKAGGWGSSGRESFSVESDALSVDSRYEVYAIQARLDFEGLTFWDDQGQPTMTKEAADHSHDKVTVYLDFRDDAWVFVTTGPAL